MIWKTKKGKWAIALAVIAAVGLISGVVDGGIGKVGPGVVILLLIAAILYLAARKDVGAQENSDDSIKQRTDSNYRIKLAEEPNSPAEIKCDCGSVYSDGTKFCTNCGKFLGV